MNTVPVAYTSLKYLQDQIIHKTATNAHGAETEALHIGEDAMQGHFDLGCSRDHDLTNMQEMS